MTGYVTFILTLAPSILLGAGACVVAVWAARLPDEQSSLVTKLTWETDASGSDSCLPDKHD